MIKHRYLLVQVVSTSTYGTVSIQKKWYRIPAALPILQACARVCAQLSPWIKGRLGMCSIVTLSLSSYP
jgi:hypothetical protein